MFKERLGSCRKAKGLSQAFVAQSLGITRQAYNHYETGQRQPTQDALIKLSSILGVTADYLLGITDKMSNTEAETRKVSSLEMSLINEFRLLNNLGQEKIIGYIGDLLKVSEYRKSETNNLKVINLPRTDGLKLIAQEEVSGEAIIIEDDEVHHT